MYMSNEIFINDEQAEIRLCSFNEVAALQSLILENLDDPDLFQKSCKEDFNEEQGCESIIYGVFLKDELTAYAVLVIPGYNQCNLGRYIGIKGEELVKVIHYDTAVVAPKFRGNSLQKQLGKIVEYEAKKLGAKYICATVSPKNKVSLMNMQQMGYKIELEKTMYGNKKRYIVCKVVE